MTNLVDKYEAKKIVAETIGDEHIIPTIGVWESFDDIDFTSLPDQFVLKCTHDSGGLVICTNKDQFDAETARKKINKSLLTNYYLHDREWPYKNVKRRIIAEEYIEDKNSKHGLHDYKMFIFNGEFKAFYVTSDRGSKTGTCIDIFDKNCNRLPFKWGYPNSNYEFKKPKNWETMIELAERLGKGYPHVRVDFYNLNGKIMFGEMTFFTWGGLVPFEPEEWDYKFGEWITLTKEKITDEH